MVSQPHIDDKAWLEQRNLLNKIESPAHRRRWLEYLEDLMEFAYEPCLIVRQDDGEKEYYWAQSPEDFTARLETFHQNGIAPSVSVGLFLDRDAPENDSDTILDFRKMEFDRLLPLYRFVAWHPVKNNYLKV